MGLAIFLHFVFIGKILLPQSFGLGPLELRYYGLFIALAAFVGYYLAQQRAKKYGIAVKESDSITFWVLIIGFIGARLYHVVSDFNFYWHNFGSILQVWRGGLSIYGAVIGGVLAVIWRVYRTAPVNQRQERILRYLDWLAPSILIGQIIGRFGNLFNYELFGYPTSLPWKMYVPLRFRPDGFLYSADYHPLFLYEVLANAIILLIILMLEKRRFGNRSGNGLWTQQGALFLSYIFIYNIVRFLLEFLRIDSVMIHGLRMNAVVSLVLAVGALIYLAGQFIKKFHPT